MKNKIREIIISDLHRYHGRVSFFLFIKSLLFVKGFKFSFWLRLAKHYEKNRLLRIIPKLMFGYYKRVLVSDINYRADIGYALCIRHVFATTFGGSTVIGNNVTILHSVTLGEKNGSYPIIGDNVYLGSGCCVLGGVTIGNNVIIGANAVVTKNIPENSIVVGNPGKIISSNGSPLAVKNPYNKEL